MWCMVLGWWRGGCVDEEVDKGEGGKEDVLKWWCVRETVT